MKEGLRAGIGSASSFAIKFSMNCAADVAAFSTPPAVHCPPLMKCDNTRSAVNWSYLSVFDTCWIRRSKETMPPRSSAGAFWVSKLFCMGEITPLARP